MNKKLVFSFAAMFVLLASSATIAQVTDSVNPSWKHALSASLNLTQVSYTDWAQGGDNALAYIALIEGKSVQDLASTNWATEYKFAYGQAKLGDKGIRKTDDKIDLSSIILYKMDVYVNPFASISFKSQFSTGYKYTDTNQTAVSDFLDPAYSTQAVGMGYQPMKELKTRLGVGLRETFTKNYPIYADDPATTDTEKTKIEGGLESVSEAEIPIDSSVMFKAKLELFAPFKTLDQIIVRSDNTLLVKISKYVNVNFNLQFINDRVVSPRTQIKEALALGLTYTVF
jgi:opacity protein-like surface antigen